MKRLCIFLMLVALPFGCEEKDFDPNDAAASFALARKSYDDQSYEIAIARLGEFKSRFPYSQHAALAELFIANSHFELGQFDQAVVVYAQFVKMHPRHEMTDFAMFRVGECYWSNSPDSADRDLDSTEKALGEWKKLVQYKPESEYAAKALEFIEIGEKRLADKDMFIARFYCKQEIYHSCAVRALEAAETHARFKKVRNEALKLAVKALNKVADDKEKNPESDKNRFHAHLSVAEIREKAQAAKDLIQL